MNQEIQMLVEKANKIMKKTGNKPGTRYPQELKNIVISMRLDYKMTVRDIMKYINVSSYSAREWPKEFEKKNDFRQVTVKENKNQVFETKIKNATIKPELLEFLDFFQVKYGIALDPIYTAKLCFGVLDLLKKDFFPPGSKVVMVHTGGLQGMEGFKERV